MSPKKSATTAEALKAVRARKPLDAPLMTALMEGIIAGEVPDTDIENALLLLRERGETASELAAAAKVLRAHALKFPQAIPDLLDTCGTGGDNQRTLNISTLSALVAASCGAKVAKHGNRAVSGVCGSADLLEMLGLKIDLSPASLVHCLEKTSFAFFFAPRYHPAVKAAMPARKRIGGKTLFNVLGPLANPASAPYQLIGVYEKRLVNIVADALVKLGLKRALVVHGLDGMDEISLSGETFMAEVRDGQVNDSTVVPEDFGLKREPASNLRCETKEEALQAAQAVLRGDQNAAFKIICLNAAAALYISGHAGSIKEGVLRAMDSLLSQSALKKVKAIAALTQGLA